MSFSADDIVQLDELRGHYPDARAASVSVMKWVQRRDGYISDEALKDCAEYLGIPAAELEGLATFYNLLFRKPVGRSVIMVCDSISCWMCGYERVRDHLRERLGIDYGQTTEDGAFTLLPVVCLGNCDNAPTLMVDDDLFDRVTIESVDAILDAARGNGSSGGGENRGENRGDRDGGAEAGRGNSTGDPGGGERG